MIATKVTAPKFDLPPAQLCNQSRLVEMMHNLNIAGVVLKSRVNVYYTSNFGPSSNSAHGEDDGNAIVIIARDSPDKPILLITENDGPYFSTMPTWIDDIRPYHRYSIAIFPNGAPGDALERHIGGTAPEPYLEHIRERFCPTGLLDAVKVALHDLGISGPIGFDVPEFGEMVGEHVANVDPVSCRAAIKWVRTVKTPNEIEILRRATRVNEEALLATIASWEPGATLRDMYHRYDVEAVTLGGFVRDPGATVVANPVGSSKAFYNQSALEDYVLEPGMHIMWDCHGTLRHYCWDGGKTWAVGGVTTADGERLARASATAMEAIATASRNGATISQVTNAARDSLRSSDLSSYEAEGTWISFHGLGLDHLEMDMRNAREDWAFETNMVIAAHLQIPGEQHSRNYLEEIILIGQDGCERFFEWDWDGLIL